MKIDLSSATLKTLRELTGLSILDAAAMFDIDRRTWRRWEAANYDGTFHSNVVDKLTEIIHDFIDVASATLEQLCRMEDELGEALQEVRIARYETLEALAAAHPGWRYPKSVHDAQVRYLFSVLQFNGFTPVVVWSRDAPEPQVRLSV